MTTAAGPVVNEKADKILHYIEIGKKEGRLMGKSTNRYKGHYIEPKRIADISEDAIIAQEEIFVCYGLIKAKDTKAI